MQNKIISIIKYIPNALTVSRGIVVVFLIVDTLDGTASKWFVWAFIAAFLSDVFDGIIARRFNAVTAFGSKMDSYVDIMLFLGIIYCIWITHRYIIDEFLIPILIVGATQTISWVLSLIKYGKLTHYHSYLAKFWAFTISVAVVSIFAFDYAGIFVWIAIICGLLSNIEDIVITLILPHWACDVLTIGDAIRLRKVPN